VLPPCVATVGAIAYLSSVSPGVTAGLAVFSGLLVFVLFKIAAKGWPIHRSFADKAAAVDGEMTDIVSNMPLVRAFGGFHRERARLANALGLELTARRNSLRYIEKLRLMHAVVVIAVTIALLGWVITLCRAGLHAGLYDSTLDPRSRGRPGRHDTALCAAGRGIAYRCRRA
jgi:ATP-binding cassette subfamily B protein